MRPYWEGYLNLALVSCPIALHAACSSAERIAFRQINNATGNRLRQQLIDEETCELVTPEHKGRGYDVAKGQYLIVEDGVARRRAAQISRPSTQRSLSVMPLCAAAPPFAWPSTPRTVGCAASPQTSRSQLCEISYSGARCPGGAAIGRRPASTRLKDEDKGHTAFPAVILSLCAIGSRSP